MLSCPFSAKDFQVDPNLQFEDLVLLDEKIDKAMHEHAQKVYVSLIDQLKRDGYWINNLADGRLSFLVEEELGYFDGMKLQQWSLMLPAVALHEPANVGGPEHPETTRVLEYDYKAYPRLLLYREQLRKSSCYTHRCTAAYREDVQEITVQSTIIVASMDRVPDDLKFFMRHPTTGKWLTDNHVAVRN